MAVNAEQHENESLNGDQRKKTPLRRQSRKPEQEGLEVVEEPIPVVEKSTFNKYYKTTNYTYHDGVRARIAICFVATFIGTVLLAFLMAWFFSGNATAWANIKDLVQLLITTESALLGAAIGFYFGAKTSEVQKPNSGD